MYPPIIGLENEYALNRLKGNSNCIDNQAHLLKRLPGSGPDDLWGTNGSRFYIDVGQHPEYATPECLGGKEAAIHDRAGELIVMQRVKDILIGQAAEDETYRLTKNNVALADTRSTDEVGFGSHENYLVRRNLSHEAIYLFLSAYLITRQIWQGAGVVCSNKRGYGFDLGQRSYHIDEELGKQSTHQKALINTRDEPHADPERYRRLHLVVGDANILFAPASLKGDITALLLLMLEESLLNAPEVAEPLVYLRAVSSAGSSGIAALPIKMADQTTLTPLEVQRFYYYQCVPYVRKNDLREFLAPLRRWDFILSALEAGHWGALRGMVDWATKLGLIRKKEARLGRRLTYVEAKRIDLEYHTLIGGVDLPWRLRQSYDPAWLASKVQRAKAHAPRHTRAHLRGRFVHEMKSFYLPYKVHWNGAEIAGAKFARHVSWNNPYQCESTRLDRVLADMRAHVRFVTDELKAVG